MATNPTIANTELVDGIRSTLATGDIATVAPGVVEFSEPIKITGIDGGGIAGKGAGAGWGGGWTAGAAILRYVGPATDKPVVHLDRTANGVIRDLVIDGNGRAGVGVLITSAVGWGSGGHELSNLTIRNCVTAIQCGAGKDDINCADMRYNGVRIENCEFGFRSLNDQSVNHHFRSLVARKVGTVFDPQRGGNIFVDGADVGTFDLWHRVGLGGPNAGTFRYVGCRFEMDGLTNQHARLIQFGPSIDIADIVFEGCSEVSGPIKTSNLDNASSPVFSVVDGMVVKLRDHVHGARMPYLAIAGGSFDDNEGRWVYHAPTKGFERKGGTIRVENSRDAKGRKIGGVNK